MNLTVPAIAATVPRAQVAPLAVRVDTFNEDARPGESYLVTPAGCTCPHFVYRVAADPDRHGKTCKHMAAVTEAGIWPAEPRDIQPARVGSVVEWDHAPGLPEGEGEVLAVLLDLATGHNVLRVDSSGRERLVPLSAVHTITY